MLRFWHGSWLALFPVLALAQSPWTTQGIRVRDEGTGKGYAHQVDCLGAGVACTTTGEVWSLNVDAAGAVAATYPTCTGTDKLTYTGTNLICSADVDTADLTIPVYARAGIPACSVAWLSKEIRVHDVSQADETWVCLLQASGGYGWATYSQAPNTVTTIMADGTVVATVGIATTSGTGVTLAVASVAAGSPTTVINDAGSTCHDYYAVQYVAVGATKRFTAVELRIESPLPASRGWDTSVGWDVNMAGPAGSTTVPPYVTDGTLTPVYHRSTTGGAEAPVGAVTNTTMTWRPSATYSLGWWYQTIVWGRSGIVSWPYDAGEHAVWPKGWRQNGAGTPTLPVAAPVNITTGDYYWVTFKPFTVGRWLDGCADYNAEFLPSAATITATAVY